MTEDRCRQLLSESDAAWLAGDTHRTWGSLEAAKVEAGDDHHLQTEVLAWRSMALLRAEQHQEAVATAHEALRMSVGVPSTDSHHRLAVAHARVTAVTSRVSLSEDEALCHKSIAELQEVADQDDPATDSARARAVTNLLVLYLDKLLHGRLHLSDAEAEAWSRVSWAETVATGLEQQTNVTRLAVDLSFSTGQWERGWRYALSPAAEALERNEWVALRSKAALLAWERGDRARARSLGQQALAMTTAVSVPWVRLYGYLAGVIAAAAGGGSVSSALEAYRRSVSLEAHATRPGRAATVVLVALDAGMTAFEVRDFLDRSMAASSDDASSSSKLATAEILLRDAEGRELDPRLLEVAQKAPCGPYLRARFHLAAARSHHLAERRLSALIELQHARYALRSWPGRVLDQVEREAAGIVRPLGATPAQQKVLALLVEGWGNRQIAQALQLSERTVAVHIAAMLREAGARSRTELVAQEVARRLSQH